MSLFHGTRSWVYAKTVKGRFQRLHRWSGVALISLLFVVPWITVGAHPAVLIDIPARRFFLMGHVFTASDGFLMVLMALIAAFTMFLASALLGRLWCGYFCPQTVFMEEWVRRVEDLFEGDAIKRRKRDQGPWTADRFARKTGKVATLTVLAAVLALTVVSYFAGASALWTGEGSRTAYTMVAIIVGFALADWLWFREQLCIYVCPYARFQSVLTDDYSLTVSFDKVPIVPGKKGVESGACIDCKKCVTVCPQGIDIRDGFQLECINCARCVDACAEVMEKFERPSLVNYTTIALQEGRPQNTFRSRVLLYSALVFGLSAVLVGSMVLHNPVEVSVQRAPGTLYQLDEGGVVRNTFLLRVANNLAGDAQEFTVTVAGLDEPEVQVPLLVLRSEEVRTVPLVVQVPRADVGTTTAITVTVSSEGGTQDIQTTFKAPGGES